VIDAKHRYSGVMAKTTVPLSKWPTTAAQLIWQSVRHPLTSKVIEISDDSVVVRPSAKASSGPQHKPEHPGSAAAPSHAG
jgi:hypothetical protein